MGCLLFPKERSLLIFQRDRQPIEINSEINSAESNAEQNSINKSSPKLGEVLVRKHIFTNTVVKTQRKVNLVKNNYKDEHFFKLLLDSNVIRSILYMS